MSQKKSTTSKKKKYVKRNGVYPRYAKPKVVKLVDGTEVMQEYADQDISKPVHAPVKKDPEKTKAAPKDEASKHKYPPPKKNPVFRSKWMKFIDGVVARENFKTAHLESLEILCDLYVEYDDLNTFIRTHGMTYKCVSRFGETWKSYPQVAQLDRVKTGIRAYTKLLDLFPKKDHSTESGGDKDDWD